VRNYWIIGDIHGRLDLLDRLLEGIARFGPEQLIFVGDYIDRGPQSKGVIDRLMALGDRAVCLMGNHELMMLNALEQMGMGGSPIELWYYNGGEATLQSFGLTSFFGFQSNMDDRYLDFIRGLQMSHVLALGREHRILVCHAGITPSIPLEVQLSLTDYVALRQYQVDRGLDPGDSFLWVRDGFFESDASIWEGYTVVHGHTPVLKLKRYSNNNGKRNFLFVQNDFCFRKDVRSGRLVSIDIDSGSVLSGRLSGLGFFPEDEGSQRPVVRMRSLTVSAEEIFPRDLGFLNHEEGKK
jgi:serine/threonine protein phosphatase 1